MHEERPTGDVAGRHGADRPGAGPSDLDGRPARRRAPGTSESDGFPPDGYARARRPAGPPGHDRPHRGRHGAGRYAVDRSGSERPAARGPAAGRHGAEGRDADDPYPGDPGGHASARHDDTVEYGPADTVGYAPGRHGSRNRRDAHARPGADDVERFDRGYLDRGQPGYTSGGFGPDEYDLDGREPDRDGSDEYGSDEYEYDSDDDGTARFPAGGGETGRRRAPDDGDRDEPAAEAPGRESPRRRGRTGRVGEPPTRRRRWPWVVGGVAAAGVIVLLALTVLGGDEEPRRSSPAVGVVGTWAPSGTGQPGAAPSAAGGAAPQPAAAEVTFEVTGSGSAGTITVSRGRSVTQLSDADLPWKQTGPAVEGPAEYSVTAAGGSGEMSCKIVFGGAVLAEEKADGDVGAVSCSGRR